MSITLIGALARVLNAGLGADATLSSAADTLRAGLGASRVAIWVRDHGGAGYTAAMAPPGPEPRTVRTLDALDRADGMVRVPLVHDGDRVGLLDVSPAAGAAQRELLDVAAEVLAPFLASRALSQHLAVEVAMQSREIEEHRRFTELIIDSLPVGLYVVDREYRIQIWNRKRETGTQGLRRDDVVGRAVFEVLTRQSPAMLRAEFDRVFETGELQQTELEVTIGGSTRHYRISKIPMRLGGDAITHVITIGEDVTDWRAIQAQIMQSEKLAALGQLAAGVMHEINNPLATIAACCAAIQGRLGELPTAAGVVQEYLDIMEREVDRCSSIVNGLLDFSRPKGKAKRPVGLTGLAEDALFLLKHHHRFKQMTVERELDAGLPPVLANAEQIIQVLMALLLNALDAMTEAGGRLVVRTGRNRVRADEVFVEVEDSGVGIPAAEQRKIFEPFYTTKAPGRGTGLGLSICYGIVEEHRGRIEVDSHPGHGSKFRVYLPVDAESP